MDRKTTFVLALAYLTIILALGLIYFVDRDLLFFVPKTGMFGPIPVGVPWFGALGAVLISLTGVFEHEHDWDMSYWPWHVARPLVGATVSVVSVLILQAGFLSINAAPISPAATPTPTPTPAAQAATTPTPTPPKPTPTPSPTTTPATGAGSQAPSPTPPPKGSSGQGDGQNQGQNKDGNSKNPVSNNLLFYLVAFLVGYREETFRELIKRLVDVVLSPGNGGAAGSPTISGANPNQAPHGTPTQVTITGSGLGSTQSVKFGSTAAQQFKANPDGTLTVTTPVMAAAGQVVLSVTTKGGAASTNFTFS